MWELKRKQESGVLVQGEQVADSGPLWASTQGLMGFPGMKPARMSWPVQLTHPQGVHTPPFGSHPQIQHCSFRLYKRRRKSTQNQTRNQREPSNMSDVSRLQPGQNQDISSSQPKTGIRTAHTQALLLRLSDEILSPILVGRIKDRLMTEEQTEVECHFHLQCTQKRPRKK